MLTAKVKKALPYTLCLLLGAATYLLLSRNIEIALYPHKSLLSLLFGYRFDFMENVGYVQSGGLFVVARSCLGTNLFLSLFLMMTLGFLPKYAGLRRKFTAVSAFYGLSLGLAFVITVLRISLSLPFCGHDRFVAIHNVLSLIVYFVSVLFVYILMEKKTRKVCVS